MSGDPAASADAWVAYRLETLARHLGEAGQVGRLLRLFADDRWLVLRRDGGDLTYAGFLDDISAAWASLRSNAAPEDDFAAHLRLGLVRTSISAISTVPPGLIVRAVATRLWPVARALGVAERHPVSLRLATHVGLLAVPDLEPDDRTAIEGSVEEALRTAGHDVPVMFLVRMLGSLDGDSGRAVADRLGERLSGLPVAATPMWELGAWQAATDDWLQPGDVADLLEVIPPAHRATLVAAVGDAILKAAERRSEALQKAAKPDSDPPDVATDHLLGQEWPGQRIWREAIDQHVEYAMTDLSPGVELLRLVGHLAHLHPDPESLRHAIFGVRRGLEDPAFLRAAVDCLGHLLEPADAEALVRHLDDAHSAARASAAAAKPLLGNLWRARRLDEVLRLTITCAAPSAPYEPALDKREPMAEELMASLVGTSDDDAIVADDSEGDIRELLIQLGALAWLTVAEDIPLVEVTERVEEIFDPRFVRAQGRALDALESAPTPTIARRTELVKGAFLRAALLRAHVTSQPMSRAWEEVPPRLIASADLSVVVEALKSLSAEPARDQLSSTMLGDLSDSSPPPRLEALVLVAPHLPRELIDRILDDALALPDRKHRLHACELLAPRLDAPGVERTLQTIAMGDDALEQAWLLETLSQGLDRVRRAELKRCQVAAALGASNGRGLGQMVATMLKAEEDATARERLVESACEAIEARAPNYRADALTTLIASLGDAPPPAVIDLVLDLPAVSADQRYSSRAVAMVTVADRLPASTMRQVWSAATLIPKQLAVGSAELFGWDWRFEFPLAAVATALAPRIPDELLSEAFAIARNHPWTPRRAIITALAERADEAFAREMLEHVLERHREYGQIPDDARSPFVLEALPVHEPVSMFKVRREVDTAELIAVLAPRLDEAGILRAAQAIDSFTNAGPRAWLPARLLSWLPSDVREDVLPDATLAAIEILSEDATRSDLLMDLLPHLRALIDEGVDAVRDVVRRNFGERDDLLLTLTERQALPEADRRVYDGYLRHHAGLSALERTARTGVHPSEEEQRRLLADMFRSPVFNRRMLDSLIARSLEECPVGPRTAGMPEISKYLPDDLREQLVDRTLEEASGASVDEAPELVAGLAPFLSGVQQRRAVELGFAMSGQLLASEEELVELVYGELLREFGEEAASGLDPQPRSVAELMWRRQAREDTARQFRRLGSQRTRTLEGLIPTLERPLREDVARRVLTLDDSEFAFAVGAAIQDAPPSLRRPLYERTLELAPGFGRAWALWRCEDHLTAVERTAAVPAATEAARAFAEPRHRCAALLTLIGLARDEGREAMLRDAIDEVRDINNRRHAVAALATVARLAAAEQPLHDQALRVALGFDDSEARMSGVAALLRLRPDALALGEEFVSAIRAACMTEVHRLAAGSRAEFLTSIAKYGPALDTWIGNDERHFGGRAVHEVCTEWRWT
jgi:hypothetical protein